MKFRSLPLVFLLTTVSSNAAINITGNVATGGATLEITNTIEFTINNAPSGDLVNLVIFDDWVASSDGGQTFSSLTATITLENVTQGLTTNLNFIGDNFAASAGFLNPTDGFLIDNTGQLAVNNGDLVRLSATTSVIGTDATFNSQTANINYTGDVYLSSAGAVDLAGPGIEVVPEPSSLVLSTLAAASLLLRRRRK